MAPSAIATIAIESSVSSKALPALENQDVHTTLSYLKRPGLEGLKPIDSGIPESQRRFVQRENINEVQSAVIKDIRDREDFTWDVQGLQYLHHEVKDVTDWTDQKQIRKIIQPATEDLVKKVTGASKTVVYLDRNRNKPNAEGAAMSTMQPPSYGNVIPNDEEAERLLNRRFIIVNVWRPIKQIRRDPLALYDWKSVDPVKYIYSDRRVSSEGVIEFGLPIYNEKHDWYYLSGQRQDEPLLFKQLDSNPETNITLLHSAFVDPRYTSFPARESIEFKVLTFFNEGYIFDGGSRQ